MRSVAFILVPLLLIAACKGAPKRLGSFASVGSKDSTQETPDGELDDPDNTPGVILTPEGKSIKGLAAQGAVTAYPRLSHSQWENGVRDLLKLSATPGLAKTFPADPSGSDFDNNGEVLKISQNHWTAYRDAAETMADRIGKDPAAYQKLIPSGMSDTKAIVSHFLRSAFRRLPTAAEVNSAVSLFNQGPAVTGLKDAKGAGFSVLIAYVLQSPHFLYRMEVGTQSEGRSVELSPFEVAARLSFAAWNTIPDAELLDLAESGEILDPKVLRVQAKRLVTDPRGVETLKSIHFQGLHINDFTAVKQDTKKFPEAASFDTATLQQEAKLFIEDVLITQKKGIRELYTAPYAFVSEKTAAAYGVPSPGDSPKKVELDPAQRAGLLTQIGFLSTYSLDIGINAIIKRGHFVSERMLCIKMGAPPAPPDSNGNPGNLKTDRERVHAQTSAPACAACHAKLINPFGFAFENLGPAGKWRTTELNGTPIDAADEYAASKTELIEFVGPVPLMKKLVELPAVHQCYIKKIVEGLYGRTLDITDANLIALAGEESLNGSSAQDLFIEILSSSQMTRRSEK